MGTWSINRFVCIVDNKHTFMKTERNTGRWDKDNFCLLVHKEPKIHHNLSSWASSFELRRYRNEFNAIITFLTLLVYKGTMTWKESNRACIIKKTASGPILAVCFWYVSINQFDVIRKLIKLFIKRFILLFDWIKWYKRSCDPPGVFRYLCDSISNRFAVFLPSLFYFIHSFYFAFL